MRRITDKPRWARKQERLRRREANTTHDHRVAWVWLFSPEDWRLFVITFAGGLVPIVMGAGVLGCTVAFARWFEQGGLGLTLSVLAITTVVSLPMLALCRYLWVTVDVDREVLIVLVAVPALLLAVGVLGLIGVGAGVQ